MPTNIALSIGTLATLTETPLVVVDPRTDDVVFVSARANALLGSSGDEKARLVDFFRDEDGEETLASHLKRALSVGDPLVFSVTIRCSGQRVVAKGRRLENLEGAPLVVLQLDPEPELSQRFRLLAEKMAELHAEVARRREAERTLAKHMAALRRLLSVVRRVSEIDTFSDDHLSLAVEAVASGLGASGAVLVLRQSGRFQCAATTGVVPKAFAPDRPLEMTFHQFAELWEAGSSSRDQEVLAMLSRQADCDQDLSRSVVLPIAKMGELVGALICLAAPNSDGPEVSDFEAGILAEAVGGLVARADFEARLVQAQKMQAIGQLTGGIAHDFNNILAVVLGNAELILDEKSGVDADLVHAIQDAAHRGATLTSRLLSFARKQALRAEQTDINVLLQDLHPMVRRLIGEDIDLKLFTDPEVCKALVDRNQLENAVLNLVLNSRDAMPAGGRLTVETGNAHLDEEYAAAHEEVSPGQYVMIAVSDTGSGMDRDVVSQAFDPFYTTKQVGKGSGLGLSMVFGFVKQSRGHVKIYSEVGRGTTIRMYFRRGVAEDVAGNEHESTKGEAPLGRGRILLVEDDPAVLKYTERTLRVLGYSVDAVLDGAEAISLLGQSAYDLLLTDVVLPGEINGKKVADFAKRIAPDVKVLFMSGYTENAIVHHGRLDPGVELIAKPFTREQLAQRLKAILEGRSDRALA